MKAGSGLAQAQSKPFCTMYAFVGTGTFIGAALLTVPKPTSTPNANTNNGERMVHREAREASSPHRNGHTTNVNPATGGCFLRGFSASGLAIAFQVLTRYLQSIISTATCPVALVLWRPKCQLASPPPPLGHSFLKSGHPTQPHPKKFSTETIRLTASHSPRHRELEATSLSQRTRPMSAPGGCGHAV